ncbi:phenylacetate--CoA ligase family protein [Desulfonatronum thioautotrophicum]|uniref:phenylacetate--CoA ligase family protein n=1 Tax=Desulfonatronum thioautotrophicum TaxID=617001 RepID=UPI0005EAF2D2|nr:phenylacetate--CoA ligase [Desulfonatronum thioautotrophicum]
MFEPELEGMGREELEQLQLERLQSTLTRVSRNVPFYRKKFDELGLDPYDFTSLDDVRELPLTTRQDLRDNAPYGLFAVPLREVVRLQTSSGFSGGTTVFGYTLSDIRKWSKLTARVLAAGGAGKEDVVHVAHSYGLSTMAFGMHYGTETLGATVVPVSSGNARRQVGIILDYRATALACIPSYALFLADLMDEMGVNRNALPLRWGMFGGEVWSEDTRRTIQERLNITATDNYGVSEVMGPGVAGECLERRGMHVQEDHFLAEIIDPQTLQPVPAGQVGELVLTTLTREALPMIRFRTGDLTRLIPDPCPCGRTFTRMERIQGRSDDMLIIQGINIYPERIKAILAETHHVQPNHLIVVDRHGGLDTARLLVEADMVEPDQIKTQQRFIDLTRQQLAMELGLVFDVQLVERQTIAELEAGEGRVVDRRNP